MSSKRGFACVGLDRPRHQSNIGGVLRAAHCYGASLVVLGGASDRRRHTRYAADTPATYRHTPVIIAADLQDVLPVDCVPVAVDVIPGARPLQGYTHPVRAFYVFGSESRTLDSGVLSWCRDVVYVPTRNCMNLAATVNVVLYDRMAKQSNGTRNSGVDVTTASDVVGV